MASRLGRARKERGWSQAQLIRRIEDYARQHVLPIASTASLKTYVSEWENGKRDITGQYAPILRAVLGVTDDELTEQPTSRLFVADGDGYAELLARIDAARTVSGDLIRTLSNQTELFRTMDRQVGAAAMTDQMTGHIAALQDALAFAVLPTSRRPVAEILAGTASLAAWQALDVGGADRAWRHYELAKTAAVEASAPLALAHAMGEQAYVLADAGRPDLAVELTRAARSAVGKDISPRLSAWLYAAEAEQCAQAGLTDECSRALDLAAGVLPDGTMDRDDDLPGVFLNGDHLSRWRGHSLALIGDDLAVTNLHIALDAIDPTFVRARSGLLCDLAQAHLFRGEYDEAATHIQQARLLANRTGSVRHRRRIARLTAAA